MATAGSCGLVDITCRMHVNSQREVPGRGSQQSYIVGSRPGRVKVGRWERPPRAPNTISSLLEKDLLSDRVDMELAIVGGFREGHFR
jgi:hypothetical protein